MKTILICALILAVGVPAVALGAGEGRSLVAGKRNPQSGDLTRETQIIASNGGYGTRQSNTRRGRRRHLRLPRHAGNASRACGPTTSRPAARSSSRPAARRPATSRSRTRPALPFTTNATGKVANLNADKLDDKDSADFAATADLLFAAVRRRRHAGRPPGRDGVRAARATPRP